MTSKNTRPLRRIATGVAVTAAAGLVLAGCTTSEPSSTATPNATVEPTPAPTEAVAADPILESVGLDGLTAVEIIDTLDATTQEERTEDYRVSIRPNELIVTTADGSETTVPMPDDAFYVSIAPYDEQTHECYFHSLTTCTGEMQNETVHVTVTDADSGEVLIDEERSTFDNGFLGLWLPRDLDVEVTIEYDGRSASAELSTRADDDATCVTTMQLA